MVRPVGQKWRRFRNKVFVENIKRVSKCAVCGNPDHRVLQFHHINDNKDNTIAKMISNACSLDKVQAEIDKCDILCANCHSIVHYQPINPSMAEW